jgi:hypothetical protein
MRTEGIGPYRQSNPEPPHPRLVMQCHSQLRHPRLACVYKKSINGVTFTLPSFHQLGVIILECCSFPKYRSVYILRASQDECSKGCIIEPDCSGGTATCNHPRHGPQLPRRVTGPEPLVHHIFRTDALTGVVSITCISLPFLFPGLCCQSRCSQATNSDLHSACVRARARACVLWALLCGLTHERKYFHLHRIASGTWK